MGILLKEKIQMKVTDNSVYTKTFIVIHLTLKLFYSSQPGLFFEIGLYFEGDIQCIQANVSLFKFAYNNIIR